MENLAIYEQCREVPRNAQKEISSGRLKGKTDINPMWRIKKLTEVFGVCGIGWTIKIANKWLETGADGEISAFVEAELRVKVDGEWSEPIVGVGGSAFVAKEKAGAHTSDECYKMAYTDAISVACKMLGMGADVYWGADSTKYTKPEAQENTEQEGKSEALICPVCGKPVAPVKCKDGSIMEPQKVIEQHHKCANCIIAENRAKKAVSNNLSMEAKECENDVKTGGNDATSDVGQDKL